LYNDFPAQLDGLPAVPSFAPLSPPSSSRVPRLPPELVGYIIKLASDSLSHSTACKTRFALLYSCSLVSSEWRPWAEAELYGGHVFILSSLLADKLSRTLESNPGRGRQVKKLAFGEGDSQLTTSALRTYELLTRCTSLRSFSLHSVFDFQIPWLAMVPSESAVTAQETRAETHHAMLFLAALRSLVLCGHYNNPFFPEIYFKTFTLPNLVELHLEDLHGCRAGLSALLSPRLVPALRALTIYPFKPNGQFDEGLERLAFFQIGEELLAQLDILVLHESLLGDGSSRFNPSLVANHKPFLLVDCVVQRQASYAIS
jgi:hypothetical protein